MTDKASDKLFSIALLFCFIGFLNAMTFQSLIVGATAFGGLVALGAVALGSLLIAAWKPRRPMR